MSHRQQQIDRICSHLGYQFSNRQLIEKALTHRSVSIRGRSPRSPSETRFEVRLTRTLTRNQVVWHLLTSTESRNHQEAPKHDYMELRHFTY